MTPSLCEEVLAEQASVRNQRGFTLLELMVVVAIVGVLSAIAFGSYNAVRDKARAETAMSELRSILTSARLVALSTGRSVQVTVNYNSGTATVKNSISATHMGGAYDGVNKKVTGNEKKQENVFWFKASTAGNGCVKAAGGTMKTIEFTSRASVTDLTDGGTPSVMVSSDAAGTKDLHCLQIRTVTGRVVVLKP